jgi:hypothetical protein
LFFVVASAPHRVHHVFENIPNPESRRHASGIAPDDAGHDRHGVPQTSGDEGGSWSVSKQINSSIEAVQGEENGPEVAVGKDGRAYVVWSIPGEKGDQTRANIRSAMQQESGGFTPARTVNKVKDTARFPIIELSPDGSLLIAWIDRRLENPQARQLYLARMSARGEELGANYNAD